jgi:hypothetical protein
MTNAEKTRHWAWVAALDRIAIPLWLGDWSLLEAYQEAVKRVEPAGGKR